MRFCKCRVISVVLTICKKKQQQEKTKKLYNYFCPLRPSCSIVKQQWPPFNELYSWYPLLSTCCVGNSLTIDIVFKMLFLCKIGRQGAFPSMLIGEGGGTGGRDSSYILINMVNNKNTKIHIALNSNQVNLLWLQYTICTSKHDVLCFLWSLLNICAVSFFNICFWIILVHLIYFLYIYEERRNGTFLCWHLYNIAKKKATIW